MHSEGGPDERYVWYNLDGETCMYRTDGAYWWISHEVDEDDVLYSATHRVEDLADPVPTPPLAGCKLSRQ